MSFRDLFRPKWRHSDPAVRLRAVESKTMPANAETLLRVLAEDTSEEVRLAAEDNLAEIAVSLAKGVFRVAEGDLIVRPNLPPGHPAQLLGREYLGFGERRGKLFVLDYSRLNSSLQAVRKIGTKRVQPALKELRKVLSEMDKVHSESGDWYMPILKMDEQNRMFLSTVMTAGHVFDLESVRNEIAEVVDSFKS